MEWVLLGGVLAAAVVAWVLADRARAGTGEPTDPLARIEDAELEAAFEGVLAESGEAARALLDHRLELLRRRRVPVRGIRSVDGLPDARLLFADGTVLLARSEDRGALIDVAVHLRTHHVVLDSFVRREPRGTCLRLTWEPDGRATVVAIGLDQEA